MNLPLRTLLSAIAALTFLVTEAHAQLVTSIRSGFEAPAVRFGPFARNPTGLAAQDASWSLFAGGNGVDLQNMARIQTTIVRSGAQALQINATAARNIQAGVSTKLENTAQFITVQADIFLQRATRPTVWQFGAGDDSARGFVGGFNVAAADGRLQVMTKGGMRETPPIIKRDVWTHVTLRFSLSAQTYDVLIDDATVATGVPFLAAARQVRVFQFATFANGNDNGFLDNVVLTAGPVVAQPVAVKPSTPAPSTPKAPGLVLDRRWSTPVALSAGGHSLELSDLQRILSPFGSPSDDTSSPSGKKIYTNVTYLQPFTQVRSAVGARNAVGSKSKVACAGFPDGLSYSTFDGSWGRGYNRVIIVTDLADQTAAIEYVSERLSFVPPELENVVPLPGDWHSYDFVQARVKGQPGIVVETRVKDFGDYILINSNSGKLHYTATWCVPKHLINIILFSTNKLTHK